MEKVYRISKRRNIFFNLSVNTVLILANVLAFIFILILLSLKVISIDSIAISPANILAGKYIWTFITSMFMHGGIFHLFANMLSLFFIGSIVERIIGPRRYLLFYLISGLFAGLFFVLSAFVFSSSMNTYAVGASGALFGLVGLLMLLTPNLPVYVMFIPIPIKMKYAAPGLLIILWLISAAPLAFGGERIPIGNTAHFGGFILGIIYGLFLRKKYKNKIRMLSRHFS